MSAALLIDDGGRAVPMALPEFGRRACLPTVASLEALRDQARREGFAEGHAEGAARADIEVTQMLADLSSVLESFHRPLQRLDQEVKAALGELAVAVAGALVGQALETRPELIIGIVERAIGDLGREQRAVDVRLHPADVRLLEPVLGSSTEVRLQPDATLARGDCRVHTEQLRIDACLSTRLKAILAELTCELTPA